MPGYGKKRTYRKKSSYKGRKGYYKPYSGKSLKIYKQPRYDGIINIKVIDVTNVRALVQQGPLPTGFGWMSP